MQELTNTSVTCKRLHQVIINKCKLYCFETMSHIIPNTALDYKPKWIFLASCLRNNLSMMTDPNGLGYIDIDGIVVIGKIGETLMQGYGIACFGGVFKCGYFNTADVIGKFRSQGLPMNQLEQLFLSKSVWDIRKAFKNMSIGHNSMTIEGFKRFEALCMNELIISSCESLVYSHDDQCISLATYKAGQELHGAFQYANGDSYTGTMDPKHCKDDTDYGTIDLMTASIRKVIPRHYQGLGTWTWNTGDHMTTTWNNGVPCNWDKLKPKMFQHDTCSNTASCNYYQIKLKCRYCSKCHCVPCVTNARVQSCKLGDDDNKTDRDHVYVEHWTCGQCEV